MFPRNALSPSYYELYVNPETRVDLFKAIHTRNIVALRFSGEITVPTGKGAQRRDSGQENLMLMPALRHVVLHGVTGNYFDRRTIDETLPGAQLESFVYAHGHRLGFEIRNSHFESLAARHGATLRKLVLLGCSRISTMMITQCLENMPVLEYFALHLVTVDDLRSNIVHAFPQSLDVLKLQVVNAWYAVPLMAEERGLCEAIENEVLNRDRRFDTVCVGFRKQLLAEDGRQDRWKQIAVERQFRLHIGAWEHRMVEEI